MRVDGCGGMVGVNGWGRMMMMDGCGGMIRVGGCGGMIRVVGCGMMMRGDGCDGMERVDECNTTRRTCHRLGCKGEVDETHLQTAVHLSFRRQTGSKLKNHLHSLLCIVALKDAGQE